MSRSAGTRDDHVVWTPPVPPLPGRPPGQPSAPQHIPELDGLRGVAIFLVMVYHQTLITAEQGLDGAWSYVARCGWCGVDLFFVLSGFLITGILLDTRAEPHYFRNFYARRALRIFPLYYAVVFISLVVLPYVPHSKHSSFGRIAGDELWYWLFLSNFAIAKANAFRHAILDVTWSLSIEEQFYLIWPAVVRTVRRSWLACICLVLMTLSLALRAILPSSGYGSIATYVLTFTRMDGLAAGALVALLARHPEGLFTAGRASRLVAAACFGWFVMLACRYDARDGLDQRLQLFGFTALALAFAAGLMAILTSRRASLLPRVLRSSFLMTLGKYSYGLYLFHLPVRAAIRDLMLPGSELPAVFTSQIPAQLVYYAVATAATVLLAWLSWQLYEKQFLKLKAFFGGT